MSNPVEPPTTREPDPWEEAVRLVRAEIEMNWVISASRVERVIASHYEKVADLQTALDASESSRRSLARQVAMKIQENARLTNERQQASALGTSVDLLAKPAVMRIHHGNGTQALAYPAVEMNAYLAKLEARLALWEPQINTETGGTR